MVCNLGFSGENELRIPGTTTCLFIHLHLYVQLWKHLKLLPHPVNKPIWRAYLLQILVHLNTVKNHLTQFTANFTFFQAPNIEEFMPNLGIRGPLWNWIYLINCIPLLRIWAVQRCLFFLDTFDLLPGRRSCFYSCLAAEQNSFL